MTNTVGLLPWVLFNAFVLGMLALDLGVFHRKSHEVKPREAITWTIVWVSLALLFNAGIYFWMGAEPALKFLTGYLIEKSLSVDNIFVFILLFTFFRVPGHYQHRVLFWGILGALIMRAILIFAGAALLENFHWVMYVFGGLLVVSGVRMLLHKDEHVDPSKNPVVGLVRRFMPISNEYDGQRFFTVKNAQRMATPLFLVLLVIETTDLIFAVDSIPAIFAVTTDPFLVYTSNVFAILGLRALYFLLAGVMGKFRFLKVGLSAILAFVGTKMLIMDFYKIPITVSLGVIILILAISVLASVWLPERAVAIEEDAA